MLKKELTVQIPTGVEQHPIAMLVQISSQHEATIYMEQGNKRINGKSIMGMMTLGLIAGETITVTADGPDEAEAMQRLEAYITSGK